MWLGRFAALEFVDLEEKTPALEHERHVVYRKENNVASGGEERGNLKKKCKKMKRPGSCRK